MKYGAVLLAIIISLPLMAIQPPGGASSPSTFYVGGSGAGNYTTIQDAIDAANDGDVIYVYPGIYNENVFVDKGVSIVGNNATIDGNASGNVVHITANFTSISGFAVENSGDNAAGILVQAYDVEIHNCNVSNNFYGIYTEYEGCNITHNNFWDNTFNAWDIGNNSWE